MFANGFVVAIKSGSHLVAESERGVCVIDFGTEYSIRLRNKNRRDAVAQIFIDGENVSGSGYVIRANSFADIERHFDTPTKFKFMSVGSEDAIDQGKNNRSETMGLIEVRWRLAVEHVESFGPVPAIYRRERPWGLIPKSPITRTFSANCVDGDAVRLSTTDGAVRSMAVNQLSLSNQEAVYRAGNPGLEGCTVPGERSDQEFGRSVAMELESHETTVAIQLVGKVKPGLARFCSNCGDPLGGKAKFCSGCGNRV